MTLVSVVTPSYNQSAFLRQTLDSVLDQDHPQVEYLVVDGGSSDGSLQIIEEFSHRLAWWVSEPDAGQAEAINKGLAHAHGEIVAWLNSDDYYLPGAISSAVKCFADNPDAVFVYGNMQAVDEAGRTINRLTYRQLSLDDLLCFQIIGQPAVFMRRSAVQAVGGLNSGFHLLLDHQLWIRLARLGRFVYVNDTWAAARYHAAAKNRASGPGFWQRGISDPPVGGQGPGLGCCAPQHWTSRSRPPHIVWTLVISSMQACRRERLALGCVPSRFTLRLRSPVSIYSAQLCLNLWDWAPFAGPSCRRDKLDLPTES